MSDIILYIMVIFSIIGGIDKLLNNRFGLGEKFEESPSKNMGALSLSMIGIIGLAPVISQVLTPPSPKLVSNISGADPSVFISSILAIDLGGYVASAELAQCQQLAKLNGPTPGIHDGGYHILPTIPCSNKYDSQRPFPPICQWNSGRNSNGACRGTIGRPGHGGSFRDNTYKFITGNNTVSMLYYWFIEISRKDHGHIQ